LSPTMNFTSSVTLEDIKKVIVSGQVDVAEFSAGIPTWRNANGILQRLADLLGLDGTNESSRRWLYDKFRRSNIIAEVQAVITGNSLSEIPSNTASSSSTTAETQLHQSFVDIDHVFDGSGNLKKSWHDYVLLSFSSSLKCTLCMRRHKHNAGYISADVYCNVDGCTGLFRLKVLHSGNRLLCSLEVKTNPTKHATKARPLCGERRIELAKRVCSSSATRVRAEIAADGDIRLLPSPNVLRIAASRQRHQDRQSSDTLLDLIIQGQSMQPAYARNVCVQFGASEPQFVPLWLNSAFEVLRSMQANGEPIVLGMDSTGAPISKPKDSQQKDVYYHAVVLRHPQTGAQPVAVMELLSSSQTGTTLKFVFDSWITAARLSVKNLRVAQVTLDFNLPTLRALLMGIHGMEIIPFLRHCYAVLSFKLSYQELQKFTLIGFGRSHIMREFCDWPDVANCRNPEARNGWKHFFGALLRCTSLHQVQQVYKSFLRLLLCPSRRSVDSSLALLHAAAADQLGDGVFVPPESFMYVMPDTTLKRASPFFHLADALHNEVKASAEAQVVQSESELTPDPNPYFCPSLAGKLTNVVMPYLPLWCGIMLDPVRYAASNSGAFKSVSRDAEGFTEGHTELWMNIVKNLLHGGRDSSMRNFLANQSRLLQGLHRIFMELPETSSHTADEQSENSSSSHSEQPETSSHADEQLENSSSSHSEQPETSGHTADEQSENSSSSHSEQPETSSHADEQLENSSSSHSEQPETSSHADEQLENSSSSHPDQPEIDGDARISNLQGSRSFRNPFTSMLNDHEATEETSLSSEVVNKKRRVTSGRYTAATTRVLLRDLTNHAQEQFTLLKNGGRSTSVPFNGKLVTVMLHNTCTVDGFLTGIAFAYRDRETFREAILASRLQELHRLGRYCREATASRTDQEAMHARATLIVQTESFWRKGFLRWR
ncbi:hypothetical protein BOX15_Mlig001973g1, partial [Macrostomum lignano]